MFLAKRWNHFGLFSIETKYKIDKQLLKQRFLRLQQEHHPDSFASQGKQVFELKQQYSSMLNTAHSILKDDLARAQYLLGCKGISLTEQDKPNQQFLMQVMELSEEIESAEGEQLNQLREEHMKRISETTHVLELASEQEDWDKFKEHTVLLSYWKRVSKLLDR